MKNYIVLFLLSGLTFNSIQTSEGGEDYESSQCVQLGQRMMPHILRIKEAGDTQYYRVDANHYYEIVNRINLLKQMKGYKDAEAILLNQNRERITSATFPSTYTKNLVMDLKPE